MFPYTYTQKDEGECGRKARNFALNLIFLNCGASAVLRFKEKIRFQFVFLDFNESAIDKDGT